MSEWLSVEKQLPEEGRVVDVWVKGEKEDIKFWCPPFIYSKSGRIPAAYLISDGRWKACGGLSHSIVPKVTHWMPLPEPPK